MSLATQQHFQRWYLLGEPPGGFCDVACCFCCFNSLEVFHLLLFNVIPHPSVSYCRVFTLILCFQPRSSQSDLRHFQFNFSGVFIFYRECYSFERVFFTLHSFLCESDAGRNTSSRIFLCTCPHKVVPCG